MSIRKSRASGRSSTARSASCDDQKVNLQAVRCGVDQTYAWYVVAVLLLAYVFSFVDRQILSLLVEPIKHDLALNDTQVSLLQGFAFAVCNGIGGLPLGRLVDTGRRMTIISIGVAFWSVMTVASGFGGRFWSLFLCRMGVGIGEASLTPAAYSVIADSVPPRRLGLALGVFSVGVHIGSGVALLLGAFVISQLAQVPAADWPLMRWVRPWQAVFVAVGLPGLLVALWTLTLREPARRTAATRAGNSTAADTAEAHSGSAPALTRALAYFRVNARALGGLYFCMAFAAMSSYSVNAWTVSLLIRTFGWTTSTAGHSFGLVLITFGAAGVIAGGSLGDTARARGWRGGRVLVMGSAAMAAAPFALSAPLANSASGVLMLLAPMIFFTTMVIGLGPSALQELVPNRMRGLATSIGVLIVNVIGLGLGPTAIALMTDYVLGDERELRYSLAVLLPCMLMSSALFAFAGRGHYCRSRERLADGSAET
jgi:MFS family permease